MKILFSAIVLAMLASQAPAFAQSKSTFVSSGGDDANACTRVSPCRTLVGTLSKTAASGVITVLDAGSYGAVRINKAISIVASDGTASATSGGVTITAGASDDISLQGLGIVAPPAGKNGIDIASAGVVRIDHCVVRGYPGAGINVASKTPTKVFVEGGKIASNGIGVAATQDGNDVLLDHVTLVQNKSGIDGDGNSTTFHLVNSTVAYNDVAIGKVTGKILSSETNVFVGNGNDGQGMGKEPLK